jgi:hypothetical protein
MLNRLDHHTRDALHRYGVVASQLCGENAPQHCHEQGHTRGQPTNPGVSSHHRITERPARASHVLPNSVLGSVVLKQYQRLSSQQTLSHKVSDFGRHRSGRPGQ